MGSTASELPSIRPDRRGYVLNGDAVDGFGDRDDIDLRARHQIARLAERYAPDEISDAQRILLKTRLEHRASELLRALADDEADLDEAFREGLYDLLDDDELRRAGQQEYPLAIGSVAAVTGATQRQIRHWEDLGLLSAHIVGGQKRYLRGGVLRAMTLAKQEQHVIATLGKSVKDPRRLIKLMGLVLSDLVGPTQIASTASEFISVGQMLERTAAARSHRELRTITKPRSRPPQRPVADRPPSQVKRKGPTGSTVHVLFSDEGWVLNVEDVRTSDQVFPSQAAALEVGRQLARQHQARLLVHRKDGTIRRTADAL